MKRLTALLLALVLMFSLTACAAPGDVAEDGELNIVTTIFPLYDWTRVVLGDNPSQAELTMLLGTGVDLHSYQPTAADLLKLATCDLFIYVGGESDAWVEDALAEVANQNMIVLNLMDLLGDAAREEETVEGMQAEAEEADEDEPEYDEHIWLSLRNAEALTRAITDALTELDSSNAEIYAANASAYLAQLDALDGEYQAAVDAAAKDTLLFGDRFPFRYLTEDYGLNYYAAFSGCSAESEASFETIVFLADKVDTLNLGTVLTIENSDGRIAQTIIDNTKTKNQSVLAMDSMQGTTAQDVEAGETYLGIMQRNLDVLKQALN